MGSWDLIIIVDKFVSVVFINLKARANNYQIIKIEYTILYIKNTQVKYNE